MSIVDDTKKFEDWLRRRCHVVEEGLREKHDLMASDQFKFFRSTCYRFARKTRELLPDLGNARLVPSVGDAHVENWGTWRDGEGRLVWGVNDFDDAALLPCTYDLLRLAASARLSGQVSGSPKDQASAILNGYNDGLSKPGPQFIDIDVPWMEDLARHLAPSPSKFKKKLDKAKTANPPAEVTEALLDQLPSGSRLIAYHKWQKGGGSLGRPRYVAHAEWHIGLVAREAKALVPSSWDFDEGVEEAATLFLNVATGRYRSPDPFLSLRAGYIVRRIAQDSQKLDADEALTDANSLAWLSAMGRDLAAIHVSGRATKDEIVADLKKLKEDGLVKGTEVALQQVQKDFRVWCEHHASNSGGAS
jgi:Uncharacterized protein conserved in bacteria (DUF2252)